MIFEFTKILVSLFGRCNYLFETTQFQTTQYQYLVAPSFIINSMQLSMLQRKSKEPVVVLGQVLSALRELGSVLQKIVAMLALISFLNDLTLILDCRVRIRYYSCDTLTYIIVHTTGILRCKYQYFTPMVLKSVVDV